MIEPGITGLNNGTQREVGRLRGELEALIRDSAALQARMAQIQDAFIEVSSEFAQHIAVHIQEEKDLAKRALEKRNSVTSTIALASMGAGVLSTIATLVVSKLT